MVDKAKERQVNDVATLKALADPVRLAIISALMRSEGEPQTVKELAAALDEPQTKLYRHVKQLEAVGLIAVAGTRLVSGIVESRYVAAQESLRLSREMFSAGSETRTEAVDAVLAAIDLVRDGFRVQVRDGKLDFSAPDDGSAGPPAFVAHFAVRLDPERMVRLRRELGAIFDELAAEERSAAPDAVEVTAFALLYGVPVADAGADRAGGAGTESDAGPTAGAG
ncbi:ArsR/SmtB family transcription factor [Kitasatospora herbaricolor]|uniref:ArsR/SmtB family transcription factor n=1 Tax=Kitasatospora herbaricolor TaxID=68217 RepID=UPI0036DCA29A